MAGLDTEGFTPSTFNEIVTRISNRLKVFSPGIDLSTESPDGQVLEIFSFELSQAWNELGAVYNSYNPNIAVGAGLRNLGMLTGLPFGAATRSQANIDLVGTAGTVVPAGSLVTDDNGNEFATSLAATIPATVQVVAKISGPIDVNIGAITTIISPVTGWDSINQTLAGKEGSSAISETAFRNLRNNTVLRNYTAVEGTIRARLLEDLLIEQVSVVNNDSISVTLPDGTPPGHIHVTIGENSAATDEEIGQVILATKGLGCPTFGSTTVSVEDTQNISHSVSFSKATPLGIFMNIEITFLSEDFAGAEDSVRADLVAHINSLATNEDVIWSRLFGIITPYAKAQVNVLEISDDGITYVPSNISVSSTEFANTEAGSINITVV